MRRAGSSPLQALRALLRDREVAIADLLSLACFALVAVTMLATVRDYGLTYDEEPHILLGERTLQFYFGGLEMTSALRRTAYGSGFDLFAGLLRRISPLDDYGTNHLLCVFVAQIGLLGTWRLGRLIAGAWAGLVGLVALVLMPVYYGHQFNNPKDIPFAVGYVWCLYFIARLLLKPELLVGPIPRREQISFWTCATLAFGWGMSVRLAGAVMLGLLLGFGALAVLDGYRLQRRWPKLPRPATWALLCGFALGCVALLALFWPGMFANVDEGGGRAVSLASNYTAYNSPTLLHGKEISPNRVPWDYLPSYLLRQLPEGLTTGFILGVALFLGRLWTALRRPAPLPLPFGLVLTAVVLPLAFAIVRGSTVYNGIRHFLFILPPLCVVAGVGVAWLLQCTRSAYPRWHVAALLLTGVFAVDQLLSLVRLHPHQQVFFNRTSGGLKAAVERYETEYYGSVYRDLHDKLANEIWRTRRDTYLDSVYGVSGCGSNHFFVKNLPLNFRYISLGKVAEADIYASYVRGGCLRRFTDAKEITSVKREGATLAAARDLHERRPRKKASTND